MQTPSGRNRLVPRVWWLVAGALTAGCGGRFASAVDAPAEVARRGGVPAAGSDRRAAPACARTAPAAAVERLDGGTEGAGAAVVLGRAGGRTFAWLADADGRQVRTVDLDAGAQVATTRLDGAPAQLAWTRDGRLVVALRDRHALAVLEPAAAGESLHLRCTVPLAAEPVALAETPDGATLLVASRWGRALTLLSTADLEPIRVVPLERDPAAVIASADGARAFVSHVAGARISSVDLRVLTAAPRSLGLRVSAVRDVLEEHNKKYSSTLPDTFDGGPGGASWSRTRVERFGLQAYALARAADGRVFAPVALTAPGGGASGSGYGTGDTVTGGFSVVDGDGASAKSAAAVSKQGGHGCLLPRAAVADAATGTWVVACLGQAGVIAYRPGAAGALAAPAREQWRLEAGGEPIGLAIDAGARRLVAWSAHDATVTIAGLPDDPRDPRPAMTKTTLQLERHPGGDAEVALGRELFHAAGGRIAVDGRACASCHPDGRDDGLSWATPDGPRQTPMLVAGVSTPPFGWDGVSRDLDAHLQRTLSRLGGVWLTRAERRALLAYVRTLRAPEVADAREDQERRGEALFSSERAACSSCHPGGRRTDGRAHDVGSGASSHGARAYDTPALRFLRQSGPWFHDGRYETLEALVRDAGSGKSNGHGQRAAMGRTDHLAPDEVEALVAYLETL
jgi:cytochrome c peroxidase